MENRKALSQNFLRETELMDHVVDLSSIKELDTVVEIGGGKGSITQALAKKASSVIVYEIDENFVNLLTERFVENKKVEIRKQDFLKTHLPKPPFKVFANIPFNLTVDIVGRLTHYNHAPQDTYLVVQQEFFERVKPIDSSNLYSLLLAPFFDFSIVYRFSPNDFNPAPTVKCVLMRIQKKARADIEPQYLDKYRDFLTYFFNSKSDNISNNIEKIFTFEQLRRLSKDLGFRVHQKPTTITYKQWLGLYNYFDTGVTKEKQREVRNSFGKLQLQQKKMTKMKRTRHH